MSAAVGRMPALQPSLAIGDHASSLGLPALSFERFSSA